MDSLPCIPSFLYGKFTDVKRETGKVIKALQKGKSFDEIISTNYKMIEIGSVPGNIVLDGPDPTLGGQPNFNVFTLGRLLFNPVCLNKFDKEILFTEAEKSFWAHLALSCGQHVYPFYNNDHDRLRNLRGVIKYKKQYISINKYVEGLQGRSYNPKNHDSIFDYSKFSATKLLARLDKFKEAIKGEDEGEIWTRPFFELIEKYGIQKYLNG